MSKFYPMVLGVDPGSRQIGISVFKGEELIYFGIKTIKDRSNRRTLNRMRKLLDELIAQHKIEFIALEKVIFVQQHRTMTKIVFEKIREYIQTSKLELYEYNPKVVRSDLCPGIKPTKKFMAENLALRYKELWKFLNVSKVWQKRYFSQLFGAVAVALVCAKEIRRNRQILNKPESNEARI